MRASVLLAWWLVSWSSIALADRSPQPAAVPADVGPPAGATQIELDRWLSGHLDRLVAERKNLAQARIGIFIQDVMSSRVLYQHRADERYNVASNTKILTTAAALAILGPEFRYRTAVLAKEVDARGSIKGDLYLRGRGDPSLGVADLERLVNDLVQAGITQVRGGLIIDDSYFDGNVLPPHFDEQPKEQAAFRAPACALSLERSSFTVVVRPALSGKGPAQVFIEPPNEYIRIGKNQLITQPSGRNRVLLTSKPEKDRMLVELGGQIRGDAGIQRYRLRVEDPIAYAGAVFRTLALERGIRIRKKKIRRAAAPPEARVLASLDSPPLAVIVRTLGKDSDNFVAEMVLKTIGAETRTSPGAATWSDGVERVRRFLVEVVGLQAGAFRYDNGSGLFDATELSPAQLVRVLVSTYRDHRYGPDLAASLAIAGVDGTLRRRMQSTPSAGLVRAKTGTLATASALAGYAAVDGLRPLAFAIAVNDIPSKGKNRYLAKAEARSLQDDIADAMVLYLRAQRLQRGPRARQ